MSQILNGVVNDSKIYIQIKPKQKKIKIAKDFLNTSESPKSVLFCKGFLILNLILFWLYSMVYVVSDVALSLHEKFSECNYCKSS